MNITLATLILAHSLSGSAWAFDSEPQPVDLADTAQVFTNANYSTGYVPSGSPLAVQFEIQANGGADVSMQGTSAMSWPDALMLQFTGDPGSGIFMLDASLDAVTTVQVDLSDWGYYGTFEIDRRTLSFDGMTFFDPFALEGSAEPRVEIADPGNNTNLITYTYSIFVGLDLTFTADLSTLVTVGFSGEQFQANDAITTTENAVNTVTYEPVGDYLVDTTFTGAWDADLDLVISPAIEACASVFGCFTVVEFDVPITLLADSFVQDFPAVQEIFPLPLIAVGIEQADMGDVEVGEIANLEVPIGNDGSLAVYGTATIEGGSDFSVYPETFDAMPATVDGVVVTYSPTIDGAQAAELVLTSNDPGTPEVRIPLTANGTLPETDSDVGWDTGEDTVKTTSSCGCASTPDAGAGLAAAMAALGIVRVARRRRA
jgi:MYXO-CTERM domain-containing protein